MTREREKHMVPRTRREFLKQATGVAGGVAAGGIVAGEVLASTGSEPPSQLRSQTKTARLRELLAGPGMKVVPEAYNVFTARLAEIHDFEAIYIGGNMMSAFHLGVEDWGLINTTELVEIGGRIAGGVSVPAIVDADQGGETSLNVYRSVGMYERAGISGFHIEDTRNPKHMGQGRSELMPLDEMVERISAAVEARRDPDFVLICRTDSLILGSNRGDTAEAIRRGNAFAEAGGDAFFCVGMRSDQVAEIARNVPIPLIALNIPVADVQGTGLRIDIHAVQVYQPAARLYEDMILELKENGEFLRPEERRLSPATSARVLEVEAYEGLAERWRRFRNQA